MNKSPDKRARGDWQTPLSFARKITALLASTGYQPATVLEPTCGQGAFLRAAQEQWPRAQLLGCELNLAHVKVARAALPEAKILHANFFDVNWRQIAGQCSHPILVLGNPPWVTNASQGRSGSTNLPLKRNLGRLKGLDALTGSANFDLAQPIVEGLLSDFEGLDYRLVLLLKSIVARRILMWAATQGLGVGGKIYPIDSSKLFGVAVDAAALDLSPVSHKAALWQLQEYDSIESPKPKRTIGIVANRVVPDLAGVAKTQELAGESRHIWRSGIKHDCAKLMEFRQEGESYCNGDGERCKLEESHLYPLLKGSEVAKRLWPPQRYLLVPQHQLGEDTAALAASAPKTWAYLSRHRERFDGRRSRVYRGRAPFSIFGVGDYAFAPWKIAIAGLYKRLFFSLVGPYEGRPVVFDDTVYYLSFDEQALASQAFELLQHPLVRDFFEARVFWRDKRPITKALLQSCVWERLVSEEYSTAHEGPSKGS